MRVLLSAAAAALALVPMAANAATWFRLFNDTDYSWYVDADSITRNGAWISVAQLAVYAKTSERTGVKSVKATVEFDCKRRIYRLTRFEPFGGDGQSQGASMNPDNLTEHENTPGSPNDAVMKFVCDNDRSGAVRISDPNTILPAGGR